MIPLPTEFKSKGFLHRQVMRSGNIAIFERWKPSQTHHFEVILIRVQKPSHRFGKDYPAKERYPSAAEWGVFAWTCRDLSDATDLADTLRRSKKEKPHLRR